MNRTTLRVLEVLGVAAVIAGLACLATPNFMESQSRSIASRRQAEMRLAGASMTARSAQEMHALRTVDHNAPAKWTTVSSGDVWRVKNGSPTAPPIWVTPGTEQEFDRERYSRIDDNPFRLAQAAPLSTFSIDVDTASYSNVRRLLSAGQAPPKDAVRIEEMINYFPYEYAPPTDGNPFAVHVEAGGCPWEPEHRLVRIGIKGREISTDQRPPANLVFLVDVSGSMNSPDKLPLVKESLGLLAGKLRPTDRVSIVVYAGASGLALPPTAGNDTATIGRALGGLESGGSTNGGAGIELAYKTAAENFIKDGINRVILCTDGDFNVGTTGDGDLTRLVEEKAKSGVFLTVLGFGTGNLNDAMMEQITNRGNGNYAYIDTLAEAKKALVEQASGTLLTIAKDVKIQVEFNPAQVQAYRLVGYENRLMANEDFNNDRKDAGEIGAGHTVTAFYEIVPAGVDMGKALPTVDPLKYQDDATTTGRTDELLTVKVRWKAPASDTSEKLEVAVRDDGREFARCSDDFVFASCVATFGLVLRGDEEAGVLSGELLAQLAESARENDLEGYRSEFAELVRKYDKRTASAD